jgi:hypothetical protein
MDLSNPDRTVLPYTDYFHLGFVLNPNITRVLFIGGGGFSGPKAFLRDYPNVIVDVVEIDPEVIRVAETYFGVDPMIPRLHIYNGDGRIYLQNVKQKYDLILIDAFSRSSIPFQVMTQEFFELIVNHLTPNGIVIFNLIAETSGPLSMLLQAETKTIGSVFPNVYVFAVYGPSYTSIQNTMMIASLAVNRLTKADFINLAYASTIPRAAALRNDVQNLIELNVSQAPILTDNYAPVENMLNPITGLPLTVGEVGEQDLALSEDALYAAVVPGTLLQVLLYLPVAHP